MDTTTTMFPKLRRSAWVAVFAFCALTNYAQQPQGIEKQSDAAKLPLLNIEKIHTIRHAEVKDDWNPVLKTVRAIHQPGVNQRKDEFLRLKAEANRLRDEYLAQLQGQSTPVSKVTSSTPPTQGVNFAANTYDFSDPADNSIGVSAAGMIVSAHNTRVHIYNAAGTPSPASSLGGFVSGSGQPTNFTFDPKVSYDPAEDKFVLVFLNGASSSGSTIIICFSETNDPNGNWNVYGINGNLNNLGVWTDFPQIGLNTNELFVTGNLFTNGGGSQGSAIWQIRKSDGYAGNALTVQSFHLPSNFSIHPVEGAMSLYGPHMYFLESDNGGGNTVSLHRISNSIANNGVLENPISFTLQGSGYAVPPDADQKGSSNDLACNDNRVQSSYFENNRIEFALNTGFGGRCALFHGTGIISPFLLSFSSFSGQIVSPREDLFAAYPSVAYAGAHLDGSNKTYLAFNYCGPNNYPSCGVVLMDSSGPSPFLTAKHGASAVNSAQSRWGDYEDVQARHGGQPGEAWMVGTYGNTAQQQRTFISQIFPPQPVAVSPPAVAGLEMDVFPNPSTERITFDFPVTEAAIYQVDIHDLQGRHIHTVIQDFLRLGEGRISFNTTALATGTYTVTVKSESAVMFREKFVVNH